MGQIEHWARFNETLLGDWGMRKRVKPGYRALPSVTQSAADQLWTRGLLGK